MAIYVDPIRKHPSGLWCHMMSDTGTEELVAFALSIGLKREWIQKEGTRYEHFDLRPSMRAKAVQSGALDVSSVEMGRKCFKREVSSRDSP